jgi:geranylgeranyl pyrophosphate synthase
MDWSFDGPFDQYWEATREHLDGEFERALPRFFDRLAPADLGAVREVLAGGKRLRGCLVCLLNDALGGSREAAVPRALAVECVHAASLVHDDLIDGDISRRNRPATWTTKGPRRAVLLGDLMFATALRRMTESGRDDGLALAEAIATMAMGAYKEPQVQSDLVLASITDRAGPYAELIHLKTGILFGTAARVGALAAGISAPLAALAFEYGARIGEAYQIADDLQDLTGVPARLRSEMVAAIEARLQQAVAAADQLPSGAHKVLLERAPRHIVRTMWVGAP